MTVKLVNLGLPKSGTTTLALALSKAGWRVADHKLRPDHVPDPALIGRFVAELIYDGYFAGGDPFACLGMYEALSEVSVINAAISLWPQCDYALLRAMRRPGVLFVATWRPPDEIACSMRRWNTLGTQRLPKGAIPGLPRGYGGRDDELLRWIEGHYAMLREVFANDPAYLELPVAAKDASARLGMHIGQEIPWWGRANVNRKNPPPRRG